MTKRLLGQAPADHFTVVDDTGAIANPNQAIFPIVTQSEGGLFRFIGTGFFVAPMGIFVTAAHVVADVLDATGHPTGPFGIFHFQPNNKYFLREIVIATRHLSADLAVGRLKPLFDRVGNPLNNRMLRLRADAPHTGTLIHTFAYPLTEVQSGAPKQKIEFAPRYFSGQIADHHPAGRDTVMLPFPCFETSMVILGGSSGGPVMTPDGQVFGVNSTGYEGDNISFVSCISPLWDLGIDGIQMQGEAAPRRVTLRELRERGLPANEAKT